MPELSFIQPDGESVAVTARVGEPVMFAAYRAGVEGIEAECGGTGTCGTCHCYVDEKGMSAAASPSMEESNVLEWVVDPRENSRLTCQMMVNEELDGAVFKVPASQF